MKRLTIFVIYEKEDNLQTYKYYFLDQLKKYSEIVSVINGDLNKKDIEKLKKYGKVYSRNNSGYDATAWKWGLNKIGFDNIKKYNQLILANDTNIGPLYDFCKIFNSPRIKDMDFWGITLYPENKKETRDLALKVKKFKYMPEHIQSYFIVFNEKILADVAFKKYWEELPEIKNRTVAIGANELYLTKYFADLGYKYNTLVPRDNKYPNLVYWYPLTAIQKKYNSPFIKKSALEFTQQIYRDKKTVEPTEVFLLINYLYDKKLLTPEIIADIQQQVNSFATTNLVREKADLYRVLNSHSYRIGRIVTYPYRFILRALGRIKRIIKLGK